MKLKQVDWNDVVDLLDSFSLECESKATTLKAKQWIRKKLLKMSLKAEKKVLKGLKRY